MNKYALLAAVLATGIVLAPPAKRRQVIDLGQLNIDGAARGPEIQFIDAQRADEKTVSRIVLRQLEALERELLKSELAGGGK